MMWTPGKSIMHRRTKLAGVIVEIHGRTAWVNFGGTETIPIPLGSGEYEVVT